MTAYVHRGREPRGVAGNGGMHMALADPREILPRAAAGQYAVPAFNFHSLDMVPALVEVAEAERAPLILQASRGTIDFLGFGAIEAVAGVVARRARVPVVLHLDHAESYDLVIGALRHGFTSVMADGSSLPYDDNVALTRKVVEAAHAAGVAVEGELGHVPRPGAGVEVQAVGGTGEPAADPRTYFTRPEEAEDFVARTGVDSLAVAIGTVHGFYRGEPRLDLDRLEAIRARVQVPLVLHGGSGVPGPMLRAAIARGVAKVNFATELKHAWSNGVRAALADPAVADPREVLRAGLEALKAAAAEKIRLCGARGRV